MNSSYKPDDYNSVSPYLIVEGAQKLIDLLRQVFNATEKRRYIRPDGKIMHVEVKVDDSIIMMSDATESYPPQKIMLHVYVPDVDATFRRAIAAGCELIEEPVQKTGDVDRRGSFYDFAGNYWSVATQI